MDSATTRAPSAPLCRWIYQTLTVDIMPVEGRFLGLNTIWFDFALSTAIEMRMEGEAIRVVSPIAFLATKFAAFSDRGAKDYYGSHDLEDIVTVIDGRDRIVEEVGEAPAELRHYIRESVSRLLAEPRFREALPGQLPSDSGSQARLPDLEAKLKALARLT